jgi:hypothetical protein
MTYIPSGGGSSGRRTVSDGEFLDASYPLYIVVTSLGTFITVNLPLANSVSAGHTFIIKDESGNNSSFGPIFVARSGSDTIDGGATATIAADYGFITVYSNGVDKWLIA